MEHFVLFANRLFLFSSRRETSSFFDVAFVSPFYGFYWLIFMFGGSTGGLITKGSLLGSEYK